MRTLIRSLWAWSSTLVLVLVWLPLLGIVRLFDRDPAHYRTGRWFRRLGALTTRLNPLWSIQESGILIDDPRRPYVVVSNHQSLLDIPVISRLPWEMKWVAKAELFRLPLLGWMMRLAGDIPVKRTDKESRARVLVHAHQYLKQHCSVMFFPEGTRSRDGRVLRFSSGAFRLAIKTGVPVLPLAIDGTRDALPKHGWRLETESSIRLKVLPPVETHALHADDADALCDEVRRQIIEQIATWRSVKPEEVDASTAPVPHSAS